LFAHWGAPVTATGRNGAPEKLPTESALAGARARLWADYDALAYLRGVLAESGYPEPGRSVHP
ncbi:MAG: hypothetical protein LC790_10985, partial [Actinobacteria bacterium]|nr:hypothetical protein [Actinomycetota bacterium]